MAKLMSETFSVVVPAYNAEKTIGRCLASILEQTFLPLEVIVIDDCSVDFTYAEALLYEERFIASGITFKFILLERNFGPSHARNEGVSLSRGSFIAFLDSDDAWTKDKLEVVNGFIHWSDIGLIYHSYSEISLTPSSDSENKIYKSDVISLSRLLLRNPAQTSCAIVRNQSLVLFDETMRFCEDYDLWMRIAENQTVLMLIGSPLTNLDRPQLSLGGLSGSRFSMRLGEMRVYYNFCCRNFLLRIWLLPGLLLFSITKHIYSYF